MNEICARHVRVRQVKTPGQYNGTSSCMSGFQRSNSSDEHDQLGLPSAHLVKKTFKNGEMGRELVRADLPAESISASTQRTREPLLNEPRIHVMLTIRVMCRRILTFVSGLFNDEGDTLEVGGQNVPVTQRKETPATWSRGDARAFRNFVAPEMRRKMKSQKS